MIISLLSDTSTQYTITSLSQVLNTSVIWLKNTLNTIAESQSTFQLYIDDKPADRIPLKENTYDHQIISLQTLGFSATLMNQKERNKYDSFLASYQKETFHPCICKENYELTPAQPAYSYANYYEYQEAFLNKKGFRHKKTGSPIHPIALFHDTLTSTVYCITLINRKITFYPIEDLSILKETIDIYAIFEESDLSAALNLINYVWSPDEPLSLDTQPDHYHILIKDQPNILEKIHHDVSNFQAVIQDLPNGQHLLEFDVISCEKLFTWLLRYGSSITVLEPLDIRERIINVYKQLLLANS